MAASCSIRRLAALVWVAVASAWLAGCAGLPPPQPSAPSAAITDVADTALGQLARLRAPQEPASLSGFRLLPEAAFAFDARISLARHAEKSLDVQYYLIQNDDVGLLLLRELREAAARGVRVRLLVDDLYTAGEDEVFSALSAFPNVEVRLFNPLPSRADSFALRLLFSLGDFGRINHRMHNKLLVADNSFAVSGGRNIANEYFMRGTAANFIDMDVLSCGPVVRRMSEGFDRYWNSEHVWPIERIVPQRMAAEEAQKRFDALAAAALPDVRIRPRDVLDHSPVGEQLATGRLELQWAPSTLFVDDPAKITRNSEAAYEGSVTAGALGVINSARREVKIGSPYFIPGARGMAMMKQAIERGGRITVVTNSLGATDEPLAYAGYERYRADMLKIGVTIYEIAPRLTGRSGRRQFRALDQPAARQARGDRWRAHLCRLHEPRPPLGRGEHRNGPRDRQPGARGRLRKAHERRAREPGLPAAARAGRAPRAMAGIRRRRRRHRPRGRARRVSLAALQELAAAADRG